MPVLLVLAILAFGAKEGEATDDNGIFDPCVSLVKLKKKDGITLGVGLAGDVSSWYNSSSTNLNLLSPCSSQLAAQLSHNAQVTVFRPVIEQIVQLEVDNASYVSFRNNFAGNASLIVYAGRNPTIVSKPRFFLYADGRVPALTLNLYFVEGKLTQMLCDFVYFDESCWPQVPTGRTLNPMLSYLNLPSKLSPFFGSLNNQKQIIVTFSGTDRYHQLLTTWYQLTNINRYSMASLFNAIEIGIQESLQRLDRG